MTPGRFFETSRAFSRYPISRPAGAGAGSRTSGRGGSRGLTGGMVVKTGPYIAEPGALLEDVSKLTRRGSHASQKSGLSEEDSPEVYGRPLPVDGGACVQIVCMSACVWGVNACV